MAVARRSDAIVYTIGVREPPRLVRGPVFTQNEALTDDRFLNALARETGGRFFHAEQHRDIERTFTRVFEEFNSRYVLGYTPRGVAQPGWHKLEVRLKTRRGDVLARRGYFGS
jgi:VWFA-related protein